MKIVDIIEDSKETLFSFEILPPLKGGSMNDIFKVCDKLMDFKPPFIDVTYHREEYIYNVRPSGYYEKIAIRKRPGTVGICASLIHKYNIEAVPHLICGGFTKAETENALIDLNFLGIQNVLALRGDARKFDNKFIPEEGGHHYASDLVNQIIDMNKGKYLDPNIENGSKMNFCIGIAGYPEKHFEAPSLKSDLKYAKMKVDAGAEYIVTQMFFDNSKYFEFVDACREMGITVPIIPGLKPLTKFYQLQSIPRHFHVNFPNEMIEELEKLGDDRKKIKEFGIEWCIAQSRELKEKGAPVLHYYTMGDGTTTRKILEATF